MLADRIGAIRRSPTLALTARVAQLRREGADIIAFNAGEPDFPTPEYIAEAGIQAIRDGYTRYVDSAGYPELREAIAHKFQRENQLRYEPSEVVITCGAKHAIFNALQALCNPGDEVIVPTPYWPTYIEQVRLAGAEPVLLDCPVETGYLPSPDDIKAAVSARTRAFLLTTPNNPTGAVWTRGLQKQIAALALQHDFWILSDEIYERLLYDGEKHESIAALSERVWERTVTIGSVSKTFAMTGWRVGWAAAPKPIIQAMVILQDQQTSNACSISMRAALAALGGPPEEATKMRAVFQERRDTLYDALMQIPGVVCEKPKGAFYLFPDFGAYLSDSIPTAASLAEYLLEEAKVAVLPGDVFGAPRCLRISYTQSIETSLHGAERIREALSKLR